MAAPRLSRVVFVAFLFSFQGASANALFFSVDKATREAAGAGSYWNHAIATELNPAEAGSFLLAQLGTIASTLPWISFVRWLGMAFLFTGITVALTVIIRTLQHQNETLRTFIGACQS